MMTLLAAPALSACGPTIASARVEHVKRVAIVGFEAPAPRRETVEGLYAKLGSHLSSVLGWTVLAYPEVAANPAMQHVAAAHPFGLPLGSAGASSSPAGLLSFESLPLLDGGAERGALLRALGVDAVAVAKVFFESGSSTTSISGFSLGTSNSGPTYSTTRSYAARTQFYLYDAGGLIWEDTQAKASPTPEANGGEDVMLGAIQASFVALTDRYYAATDRRPPQ